MNERARPIARIAPLPVDHSPDLQDAFAVYTKSLGFVPNSVLIMQRKPAMVKALAQLAASIWSPDSLVDRGTKRLIGHMASRAAGCQYCMAHTAGGALHMGIEEQKLAAIWDYQTSPLYSAAERIALDFALAAAQIPNAVTDALFAELRRYWTEDQIVEIVGVISLFGFMNRWNDTMATPIEDEPLEVGDKYLASHGWSIGKH